MLYDLWIYESEGKFRCRECEHTSKIKTTYCSSCGHKNYYLKHPRYNGDKIPISIDDKILVLNSLIYQSAGDTLSLTDKMVLDRILDDILKQELDE